MSIADPSIPDDDLPPPNYAGFTYPGWKVTQTAPPTYMMNPVWRITNEEGQHVATLAFESLEYAVIHLWLSCKERQRLIDAALRILGEDADEF